MKLAIHYGDYIKGGAIYTGSISTWSVLKDWHAGTKIVRWWQGTDVLECVMYPPGKNRVKVWLRRAKTRFLKRFLYEDWFVSDRLSRGLPDKYRKWPFGSDLGSDKHNRIMVVPGQKLNVKKLEHSNFNVLVYWPKKTKYNTWVYGLDIIDKLILRCPEISWIFADGTLNMEKVYAITDLYLRPSRWDGMPKMVLECQDLGIPYYWSEDGKPDLEKISRILKSEVLNKTGSLANAVLGKASPIID